MADKAENKAQGTSLEQVRVYARELHQLYRAEHQARQELEARTRALEQKVRELAALNRLFQTHMHQNLHAQEALQNLLTRLKALVAQAEASPAEKTRA
jgi:hypothetical protein